MEPSVEQLTINTTDAAADELDSALKKITHCLNQLTDEQVWWRPAPSMNSIGNLILHLGGNIRQWITAGVGGVEDIRDRPEEFSERGPIARAELLRRLEATVAEAKDAMRNTSAEDLAERRCIQAFDVTGLGAIFHSVSHFRGHTQEIVHMVRMQLGDNYEFAFVPKTPEQGAPQE